jgi:geranylgeranyl diphosphate synthase type I
VFGTSAAILLGDLLLSWADAMFAGAVPDGPGRRVFDDMRQLVMAGQYLDVLVQARAGFSVDEALRVIEFKTSKYTVEGPLHLGAAIAGASAEVFEALTRYGLPLGEAFQLRDDVLGVFGDPSVTGKPAGDDLREGKHTLLTALAMQSADPAQAATLAAGLGDRSLDEQRVAALCRIIVATGALEQVEQRIADRAAAARDALAAAPISEPARAALSSLADAATDRHA